MGRLVHCHETCSHINDFKDSVATVFRNAVWRGYPKQMVEKVWRRFLFQRWHAVDIRVKELRVWFPKVWAFLLRTEGSLGPSRCCQRRRCRPSEVAVSFRSSWSHASPQPSQRPQRAPEGPVPAVAGSVHARTIRAQNLPRCLWTPPRPSSFLTYPSHPPLSEGSELDDMDEDPEPQGPSQVEVSETLCRRTMVRASKAGTVGVPARGICLLPPGADPRLGRA